MGPEGVCFQLWGCRSIVFCVFFSGSLLVSLFRGCRGRRGVWYLDLVGYVSVFFVCVLVCVWFLSYW